MRNDPRIELFYRGESNDPIIQLLQIQRELGDDPVQLGKMERLWELVYQVELPDDLREGIRP